MEHQVHQEVRHLKAIVGFQVLLVLMEHQVQAVQRRVQGQEVQAEALE
jgi:hypothetical protein